MRKKIYLFLISVFLIITSCSNNNEITQNVVSHSNDLKINLMSFARTAASTNQANSFFRNDCNPNNNGNDCFTLLYPVTVTNGQIETVINNETEGNDYANANPNYEFVFPINILYNGSPLVVNNQNELSDIYDDCFSQFPCFSLNFPLGVVDINGNQFIVNDIFELFSTENLTDFIYPFSITLNNGPLVVVNNAAEFDSIYNECHGIDDCSNCPENCFEIVYPITLIKNDGTITTINNDNEFDIYMQSLTSDEYFTLSYPLNIVLSDGTQQSINNDADFVGVLENCI